jgi:trigger factor
MDITVQELEACKLSINYVAGPEEILNKRGEILQAFKKAPVPGFRKGKANLDAIRVHYRTQIEESLKRGLAEDAYHNTLFEKKLKPHGAPRFNSLLLADGKFTCEFELYTKPAFELSAYTDLEFPKPHEAQNVVELTEELLQNLRVRFGEAVPYSETDFVQKGDNIIIDYEGTVDGVKVDQLCAVGEMLTVGNSNLTQFDDNLYGMILGESREFNLLVPEGALPSLAGKTIVVKVTLNMGSKITPCPLNDELAVKLGKKDFQELKEFAHATASAGVQNKYKESIAEAVAARLVDSNTIDVPNWMSLSEAQYLVHQAKLDWNSLSDPDKEKYLQVGEKNVKLSLILDRIREENPEAQLTDQEVFDVLKQNLAKTQTGASMDDVIQQMNKTGYLQILFSRIRDEHTMDFITKTVKVIE